jgi:hypothetical protein
MAVVHDQWLSRRAVSLHLAALVLVSGCAVAAWWQINRAADGNQLSYLYSVMWPAFGLLSVYFWWALIHTDYDSVGLKGMLRQQAAEASREGGPEGVGTAGESTPVAASPAGTMPPASDIEDPELAAYNARLAALAAHGPKTWRGRESVVVRREQ